MCTSERHIKVTFKSPCLWGGVLFFALKTLMITGARCLSGEMNNFCLCGHNWFCLGQRPGMTERFRGSGFLQFLFPLYMVSLPGVCSQSDTLVALKLSPKLQCGYEDAEVQGHQQPVQVDQLDQLTHFPMPQLSRVLLTLDKDPQ